MWVHSAKKPKYATDTEYYEHTAGAGAPNMLAGAGAPNMGAGAGAPNAAGAGAPKVNMDAGACGIYSRAIM